MWSTAAAALLAGLARLAATDTYCDASVPCSIGCCSSNNVCSLGPTAAHLSASKAVVPRLSAIPAAGLTTTSTPQVSPQRLLQQYGFYGTTKEFCGDEEVTKASCDVDSQSIKHVIGYYASSGTSRSCDGILTRAFPQGVYSHIHFSFGSIDLDTFEVILATSIDKFLYLQLSALKSRDLGQEL
ncbi:hypothetical protein B0J13DRAFT_531643 [Dactylonectria estremocensis]|uniref:GH18 domain-containing protein n=1 Tax=Dactylonectria estremocensis TaxID=1079267 RepID=A0A9P9IHA1_9HYPO|nr:hypothetical protein B0J13DRAFT_531643 [Dactylonectria estremocensis]